MKEEEYGRIIKHWNTINKMCVKESKSKILVFRIPRPRKYHIFNPIDEIELVNQIKLLRVITQDIFLHR